MNKKASIQINPSLTTTVKVLRTVCALRFLLLLLFAIPAAVQAQFICTTNSGTPDTITITGLTTNLVGDVTIPGTIDGLQVVSIADSVFSSSSNMTSIIMENGIKYIGNSTFSIANNSLTNIVIPDSVLTIGHHAFAGNYLASFTIGNGIVSIGWYAFYQCGSLTSIRIPDSTITIARNAFTYCTGLTNILIGNHVTSIDMLAFSGCTSLPNISIPTNISNIARALFAGCSSLTNVTIPDTVTNIDDGAFLQCGSLSNIIIPESVVSLGGETFMSSGLSSIALPNSITSI